MDKRYFTTLPVRVLSDSRLTGLDMRCLAVISIHDGMSLLHKGKAGCYARHDGLAERIGTDTTNFSKCLKKLRELGYVVEEKRGNDGRRRILRVVFEKPTSVE